MAAVAEAARQAYSDHRLKRIEETILKAELGADFTRFQEMVTQSPTSQTLFKVSGNVQYYNPQVDLLIAGLDAGGASIYVVQNPGNLLPFDNAGFCTVGAGSAYALVTLVMLGHTRLTPAPRAVYNVYRAKRASEIAPGVGRQTDLIAATRLGLCTLDSSLYSLLDESWSEELAARIEAQLPWLLQPPPSPGSSEASRS